jgi:hypothetical protein
MRRTDDVGDDGFHFIQISDGLFLQSGLFCHHSGKEALARFLREKNRWTGWIVALPNVDTQQPNIPPPAQ